MSISTCALREEGDPAIIKITASHSGFLSTPSARRATSNGLLNVGGQAEAFLDSPKITGTIPRISTKGWSGGQTLDATPQMDAYKIHPAESGDGTATGEKPQAATLGASSAATVSNAVKVEAFKVKPRVCGRAKCNK